MTPADLVLTPRGVRFRGRHLPCSIGSGGVARAKKEGDGATPAGVHHVAGMLYRADRIARPTPWAVPIGPGDLWSDDPRDPSYNQLVSAPYPASHERLARADPLYDLIVLTNWNWPHAIAGRGSAIFLHRWRRPRFPTEGCLAFRADHLLWIAQRLRIGTRIVVPNTQRYQPDG